MIDFPVEHPESTGESHILHYKPSHGHNYVENTHSHDVMDMVVQGSYISITGCQSHLTKANSTETRQDNCFNS